MMSSLDLTITATAVPYIASHFDKLNQLNWIVTAFSLTASAFIPAFGLLADVFGRHVSLQTSLLFLLVGSALCAGARTFPMLLFGRALQGISQAGITVLVKIVLADKVSLKDNAKNSTWYAAMSGLTWAVGPVIGGYLTRASWRYCFVINIPPALIGMIVIYYFLRKELVGPKATAESVDRPSSILSKLAVIDIGGLLIFLIGVGLIILATAWGGATYAWNSVAVVTPLVIGSILFAAFFVYEYLMESGRAIRRVFPKQQPMVPVSLFYKKDMGLLSYVNIATGAAIYAVFYFVGIYFTLVEGYEPEKAGLQLLYYLPGIATGVYLGLFFANTWPRDTFLALFLGSFTEALGVGVLTWALSSGRKSIIAAMMAIAGFGSGLRLMPATLHIAGIWPDRLAPAMSITDFVLDFGGTIALAMMGSVFNNKLVDGLPVNLSPDAMDSEGFTSGDPTTNLQGIAQLSPEARAQFNAAARRGVVWAFTSIMPVLGLAIVAAALMGNVWITKSEKRTEQGHLDSKEDVLDGYYLWELLKGRRQGQGEGRVQQERMEGTEHADEKSVEHGPSTTV
ncbi:MAG: hypothetical protein M1817_000198 [Caeruleum heppii]|nr:MAG: hypothetical protein M1817_000198 [Caeruleum heppii]